MATNIIQERVLVNEFLFVWVSTNQQEHEMQNIAIALKNQNNQQF